MIVLALVLLIIVLAFSVAIVLSNPDVYQLSLFRVLVPVTSAGVFFTGFGAALVTITALLLLRTGIRRSRETRRRLRTAEQAAIGSTTGTTPAESVGGRTADPDRDELDLDDRADQGSDRDAAPAIGRTEDRGPADPPASTLDFSPGEDATTVPADRRKAGRDPHDRDEPRA